MSSTLILRDATIAINGAHEAVRGEPREFLRGRIQEVSEYEPSTLTDCITVLRTYVDGEEVEADALLAVLILGLAHPTLAARHDLSPVPTGRRLAMRMERKGDSAFAKGILETLLEFHPTEASVRRDLDAFVRRQGMIHDLVESHLQRAREHLKAGDTEHALERFREAFALDRTRSDVARAIRDLRFQNTGDHRVRQVRWRMGALVLIGTIGISWIALHELQVRRDFQGLPLATLGDLQSMSARLGALEGFMEEHPLWHGSYGALRERSSLRTEVMRLRQEDELRQERERQSQITLIEDAILARERGLLAADGEDFATAIEEFKRALEIAPEDWAQRSRTERDLAALEEFVSGSGEL